MIRRFTLCPAVTWPNISFICHQQTTLIKLKLHVPLFYIYLQILRVFQRMALIAHGEFLSMSGDVYTFLLITCSLNYQIHGKAGRLTQSKLTYSCSRKHSEQTRQLLNIFLHEDSIRIRILWLFFYLYLSVFQCPPLFLSLESVWSWFLKLYINLLLTKSSI